MGKRGRKPGKDRKGYFYEQEEEAVVKYVSSTDVKEKEEIYHSILEPAFTKMIESIIRRYNLYPPDEVFQETFDDTLSFLLTKIEHFNPDSGFKAYSYCGTVCKNYLILKINQYQKRLIRNERYETIKNEITNNLKFSYGNESGYIEELTNLINDTAKEIQKMIDEKEKNKLTDNEIKVGEALCNLLLNWGELFARMGSNKFNKSSILLYLKEITLLNTNDIRNAMKKYRSIYQKIRKKMLNDIY